MKTHPDHHRLAAAITLAASLAFACSGDAPEILEPEGAAPQHMATADGAVAVGPMMFHLPEGWTQEAPENSMRAAQFTLPGGDGTTLVIFFFGVGGGGGVDANMDRWTGQMTQPDGSSSSAVAKRSSEERNGMKLHYLDVTGDYAGMGQESHSNWRMLGTVIECEGGPYFFKLTGPAASVASAKADYDALLSSITVGGTVGG